MEKRLHELEEKVDELSRTVEQLRARLDAPPSRAELTAPVSAALGAAEPAPLPDVIDPTAARSAVPLVGRSLLVIAGAFVFRLITERELVSRPLGITLGLAFAALWVFLAWRDAQKGQRLSAAFHAGAGSLIGFSLLLETGSQGSLVSAPVAALALAGFTGLLMATAWRHRLPEVAWLAELGCLAVGGGLLRTSEEPVGFFLVLLGLGACSVACADLRQWPHLRWPVALFLDLTALRLVFSLAARPESEQADHLGPIVLVTQAVIGLYVLALLGGTWFRARPVRGFEVVQTLLVLTVGLATITRVHGASGPWGLLVAAGAIVTALYLAPTVGRRFDSWFYGGLAIALTFAAGPLVLEGVPLGIFFAVVGLALAGLGRWRLTNLLWAGAALLAWGALLPAGTFGMMISGLAHAPGGEWAALTAGAALPVFLALASWVMMTVRVKDREDPAARFIAMTLLALTVLGGVALFSHGVRAGLGGPSASAAVLIPVRTLLLCGAAVGLAAGRRLGATIELNWVAWGLLVLSGLKVLLQDLPNGQAGTLVVAFLALGLAIIAVPRLLKAG